MSPVFCQVEIQFKSNCVSAAEYSLLKAAAGTKPKGSVTHKAVHRAIGTCAAFLKRHRANLQPQQQGIQTASQSVVLLQGGDCTSPFSALVATAFTAPK